MKPLRQQRRQLVLITLQMIQHRSHGLLHLLKRRVPFLQRLFPQELRPVGVFYNDRS